MAFKLDVDTGNPVPNSPYGLCGRKATSNLTLLFSGVQTSRTARPRDGGVSQRASHVPERAAGLQDEGEARGAAGARGGVRAPLRAVRGVRAAHRLRRPLHPPKPQEMP